MKNKLKSKFIAAVCILLLGAAVALIAHIQTSPSAQLLVSVISFSEKTLKNPEYLLYNVDIMDMFQNYTNADVSYEGEAYFKKVKNFNYSTSGKIQGERSFSQRKMSCKSDMNVLWENLGGVDIYAQDETMYLVVPLLGDDFAYAFDTELDLFKKGPAFTSDIDRAWFHDNAMNLYDFFYSIDIEKTGDEYIDDNGTLSYEYKMTIPQGEGQFLWDLLGIDAPTDDIIASMYLDKHYHIHRIVFDLSKSIEGAQLELLGENCNTMLMTIDLPDNERCVMTVKKDASVKYINTYTENITYTANNGYAYTIDSVITMERLENGVHCKASDIVVKKGTEELASGYVEGTITKQNSLDDVFRDSTIDFDSIEAINWKVIRDDTKAFLDEVIEKSKNIMKLGNLPIVKPQHS